LPNASVAALQQPSCVLMFYRKTRKLSCKKVSAFAPAVPRGICRNADTGAVPHSTAHHENTGDI
jgi:hypothetical protein